MNSIFKCDRLFHFWHRHRKRDPNEKIYLLSACCGHIFSIGTALHTVVVVVVLFPFYISQSSLLNAVENGVCCGFFSLCFARNQNDQIATSYSFMHKHVESHAQFKTDGKTKSRFSTPKQKTTTKKTRDKHTCFEIDLMLHIFPIGEQNTQPQTFCAKKLHP